VNVLETSTLADRVYEILKQRILRQEFAHGEKLNLSNLASELNVSNTPVREAISRLEKVGLVNIVPYRGPYVRSLSRSEIAGVFDVRIALEVLAARLAANNTSAAMLAEIESIQQEIEEALDSQDLERALDGDVRFHESIARASCNTTLINLLQMLSDWIRLFMQFALPTPRPSSDVNEEHRQILATIRAGDHESAGDAMRRHIVAAKKDLILHLAEKPEDEPDGVPAFDHQNIW
jgi:DNA-binding GntR family transcriptional regulator